MLRMNSNRARYYDPSSGRFLSEDPIGFAGGDYNLYRYVGNNPVKLVDPSGETPVLLIGPVIAFEIGYDVGTFVNTLINTGSITQAGKETYAQSPLRNLYNTGTGAIFPEPVAGPIQAISDPNTMNVIIQNKQRNKKIDKQVGTCE